MTRLYGCQPSPDDDRDWALGKFGAPSFSALPTKVDYSRFVEEMFQQRGNSCCGWGTTRAWHVRARIQGDMAVRYPSAPLNYTLGRCALQGDVEPLADDGCWIRLTLLAAAKLGMVPLERWNDPANQNVKPDWETLRRSVDRRSVTFARVYGTDEMALALAMGHPLVVGFDVGSTFDNYAGGIWEGPEAGLATGHCTSLVGYNFEGAQDCFIGVNSWGADWGEGGLYRISKRSIPLMRRFEAWAVQLVNTEAA